MARRSPAVLALALVASVSGCASSRSLLREPVLPGEAELYAASREQVLAAVTAAVEGVGLEVDEVVEGPGEARTVLASRGWSFFDYGAIARVIVEPAPAPAGGTWVRVTSRLKMRSNLAGKADYREDIFGRLHRALREGGASTRPLPAPVMAARVDQPLAVGTVLRIDGVRTYVSANDGSALRLDDGSGQERTALTLDLTRGANVERLIRERYRWERLLGASAVGVGLGLLLSQAYGSDLYGNMGTIYGVTIASSAVMVGAVWGNRDRTRWRTMR